MPLRSWQPWGIDHLSREPVPIFEHPLGREMHPNVYSLTSLVQLWTIPTWPVNGSQEEEVSISLSPPPFLRKLLESNEVTPQPPLLHTREFLISPYRTYLPILKRMMWNKVFKERIKLNACIPTIFNGFIFQQKYAWLKEASAVFLFWCIVEDVGIFTQNSQSNWILVTYYSSWGRKIFKSNEALKSIDICGSPQTNDWFSDEMGMILIPNP